MDLGLRPLPGPRREDGVPSVPRGVGRAPRRVAALAARRGRGRPLHLDRRDARRQAGRVRAPDKGCRPVQVVLARRTRLAGASTGRTLHALRAPARARGQATSRSRSSTSGSVTRRSVGGDGAARAAASTSSSIVDAAGRQARRRREAGLRRLVEAGAEGRSPAAALRPAARPARDGSRAARRTSRRVPSTNESTLLGQIATRARRVAAALERRRHLGPLARARSPRGTARSFRGAQSRRLLRPARQAVDARHARARVRLRRAARLGRPGPSRRRRAR